jgi:hypothetical protein
VSTRQYVPVTNGTGSQCGKDAEFLVYQSAFCMEHFHEVNCTKRGGWLRPNEIVEMSQPLGASSTERVTGVTNERSN